MQGGRCACLSDVPYNHIISSTNLKTKMGMGMMHGMGMPQHAQPSSYQKYFMYNAIRRTPMLLGPPWRDLLRNPVKQGKGGERAGSDKNYLIDRGLQIVSQPTTLMAPQSKTQTCTVTVNNRTSPHPMYASW